MQRKKSQGVEWLEFELLSEVPGLFHAVFLRQGGVSQGNRLGLNLSYSVGDDPNHVKSNFKLLSDVTGIGTFYSSHITHGVDVADITPSQKIPTADAIATATPGVCLLVTHADCQVAFLYDPIHRAIANVHSGWRGSVHNIYEKAIHHMQRKYGSKPQDLLVCIGPSLGPQSAEFIHYKKELPESFWDFQVKPTYFDFWAISEKQLKACGILSEHIEIARIDNYQNLRDCFSHRRDKPSGRHGSIISLL